MVSETESALVGGLCVCVCVRERETDTVGTEKCVCGNMASN